MYDEKDYDMQSFVGTKSANLAFVESSQKYKKNTHCSTAVSPQLYQPTGLMMSASSVNANTTRENAPHARPKYTVASPEPVTLQFTNENPVSSLGSDLFCAVRDPFDVGNTRSSHSYMIQHADVSVHAFQHASHRSIDWELGGLWYLVQ